MNFISRENLKLSTLGVGTIKMIEEFLGSHRIEKYVINNDLTIEVDGNVYIDSETTSDYLQFPNNIKFGTVNGFFICHSTQINTLAFAPKRIHGNFICINNPNLNYIDECPKTVDGDFVYYGNGNNSQVQFIDEVGIRNLCEVKGHVILKKPEQKY